MALRGASFPLGYCFTFSIIAAVPSVPAATKRRQNGHEACQDNHHTVPLDDLLTPAPPRLLERVEFQAKRPALAYFLAFSPIRQPRRTLHFLFQQFFLSPGVSRLPLLIGGPNLGKETLFAVAVENDFAVFAPGTT
jgi:hypothetical protein